MMRFLFGVVLALLVIWPPLFGLVLFGAGAVASQPPLLAFAAGVVAWPHLARRIRRWLT